MKSRWALAAQKKFFFSLSSRGIHFTLFHVWKLMTDSRRCCAGVWVQARFMLCQQKQFSGCGPKGTEGCDEQNFPCGTQKRWQQREFSEEIVSKTENFPTLLAPRHDWLRPLIRRLFSPSLRFDVAVWKQLLGWILFFFSSMVHVQCFDSGADFWAREGFCVR